MGPGDSGNGLGSPSGPLSGLASVWPALNRTLQANQSASLQNQAGQLALNQKRAELTNLSDYFGGFAPGYGQNPTDINWNTGDPTKIAAAGPNSLFGQMAANPQMAALARINPNAILSQIAAPPSNMQVTDPSTGKVTTRLMNPLMAMNLQMNGYQVAEAEKAKPADINQAPTFHEVPGAQGRQQTVMWTPGSGLQNIGGPGDFTVKAPGGDLGDLLAANRFATFGGGIGAPGHSGAPAPGNGVATPSSPTPAAASSFTGFGVQPRNAAPSATGATVGSSTGGAAQPQPAAPSISGAFAAKLSDLNMTAAQKAAAAKSAEMTATETTPQPKEAAKAQGAVGEHMLALDQLENSINDAMNDPHLGSVVGLRGQFPNFPGSSAANAAAKLNLVKNQSILNVFQSARDMSTTGGGVGRLTETELPIFQNAIGNLEKAQDVDAVRTQLGNMKDIIGVTRNNIRNAYKDQFGKELSYESPSRSNQVPQAPAIAAQRSTNTIYATPRGNLKWTGTGWVKP